MNARRYRYVGLALLAGLGPLFIGEANAITILPTPTLSVPVTSASWSVGDTTGPVASDVCSKSGANCSAIDTYQNLKGAASAAFSPNLAVPSYINPEVSAFVSGSAPASTNTDAYSIAQLAYNFEVFVPTTGVSVLPITLDLTAKLSASISNSPNTSLVDSGALAQLYITDPSGQGVISSCVGLIGGGWCAGSPYGLSPSKSFVAQPLNIYANEVYTVQMEAYTQIGYGSGTATADVDPFFAIDPSSQSLNPSAELFLSPGVYQSLVAAVPEPSTWAMFIIGFGLVGFALRSRRKYLCVGA